jgi:hypothetical protein
MAGNEMQVAGTGLTAGVRKAALELGELGWTRLDANISDRLLRKIVTDGAERVNFRYVRQIYDGLPMRIAETLLGTCHFSGLTGIGQDWSRVGDGSANDDMSPGPVQAIELIAPLGPTTLTLAVMRGSARLTGAAHADEGVMLLAPGDLAMLDARLLRRTVGGPCQAVSFFVCPASLAQREIWPEATDPKVPRRAATFFGGRAPIAKESTPWINPYQNS